MAELQIEGDELTLHLSGAEKVESVHGDLRVPLSAVTGIEVLEDAHGPADLIGFRVGTRLPRVIEVASVRGLSRKIFTAVHHDTPRGVRVFLGEGSYDEWIVGCADPEGVIARLGLPRAGS